jgi:hypothetical protein
MKKLKTKYDYTCDVCGKPIKSNELVSIVIPQAYDLGEDGVTTGTHEWHFHYGRYTDSCSYKFSQELDKIYKGQKVY